LIVDESTSSSMAIGYLLIYADAWKLSVLFASLQNGYAGDGRFTEMLMRL
jgi:hypothetical protein